MSETADGQALQDVLLRYAAGVDDRDFAMHRFSSSAVKRAWRPLRSSKRASTSSSNLRMAMLTAGCAICRLLTPG